MQEITTVEPTEAETNQPQSAEEAMPKSVEQKQVDEAYQKFSQRCCDLGIMIYQKKKQDGMFEDRQKAFLFDIDKLAQKHDKLLAKLRKAQQTSEEVTT